MGAGGSIQNMINTLKNNRALLKGKHGRAFNVERYREIKQSYVKSEKKLKLNHARLSEAEKALIRKRVRRYYRRVAWRNGLITLSLVAALALGGYYLYLQSLQEQEQDRRFQMESADWERRTRFNDARYIGDDFWDRQDYHRASKYYQQALEIKSDAALERQLVHCLGLALRQNPGKEVIYRREVEELIAGSGQREDLERLKEEYF